MMTKTELTMLAMSLQRLGRQEAAVLTIMLPRTVEGGNLAFGAAFIWWMSV